MSVNQKLTSRTENTSLRVLLCESGTSDSIFKILPRYKVCSVGDVVRNTIIPLDTLTLTNNIK